MHRAGEALWATPGAGGPAHPCQVVNSATVTAGTDVPIVVVLAFRPG